MDVGLKVLARREPRGPKRNMQISAVGSANALVSQNLMVRVNG